MNSIAIKRYATFVVYMFLSLTIKAAVITGMVADTTGCPLPYSTIAVGELNVITTSDQYGKFAINNITPGLYTLQISCIGYKTLQTITEVGKDDVFMTIKLQELVVLLNEVVVNSNDMASMILEKLSSTPKLMKNIKQWCAKANSRIESVGNLGDYPPRLLSILRFSLGLMGYKKIFQCVEKYPNMMVGLTQSLYFKNGKLKASNGCITECSDEITNDEKLIFIEKRWGADENIYDKIYRIVRKLNKNQKKANKNERLQYMGTYKERGYRIHILKSASYEIHVVANCWQIYKMTYQDAKRQRYIEFKEYPCGLFLPISSHSEDIFDLSEEYKWKLANTVSFEYETIISR